MQAAETDGIQGSLQALFSMSEKTSVKERYDADGAAGGDCDSRHDRHGAWRRRDDGKKCLPEDAGSGRCRAGAVAHGTTDDR